MHTCMFKLMQLCSYILKGKGKGKSKDQTSGKGSGKGISKGMSPRKTVESKRGDLSSSSSSFQKLRTLDIFAGCGGKFLNNTKCLF